MMKEITIETYSTTNKNCSDLVKRDVHDEFDKLKKYLDTVFTYISAVEDENERLKSEKSRLYAENSSLKKAFRKQTADIKDPNNWKTVGDPKSNELDDVYKKLKELRAQKVKWEEELDKCMNFVQDQYDDLK